MCRDIILHCSKCWHWAFQTLHSFKWACASNIRYDELIKHSKFEHCNFQVCKLVQTNSTNDSSKWIITFKIVKSWCISPAICYFRKLLKNSTSWSNIIHPSIFWCQCRSSSCWRQSKQRQTDLTATSSSSGGTSMHSQTNPEIKSHHCSASTLRSILSWKCLYHITRWCDGQMTKHLNWLLLTWRSSSYTPSLILITKLLTISLRLETRYPLKEAHFHHL